MPATFQAPLLLDARQVCERIGFSRVTMWRWVRRGAFPAPVYPAPRLPRWRASDIESWLLKLPKYEAKTAA